MNIKQIYHAATAILWPRHCPVCHAPLAAHEQHLCTRCLADLPRTRYHAVTFNPMEQLFAGKTPIERATGLFFYSKQSPYAAILHDIKYRNTPQMGTYLAELAANELVGSGFFDGIDLLVPVPLHPLKKAQRGYNQSEEIAQGISKITGIEIRNLLRVTRINDTQTRKSNFERYINTQGLYESKAAKTDLDQHHILLIDDVITTSATLCACAEALHAAAQQLGATLKISVFTLAVAKLD